MELDPEKNKGKSPEVTPNRRQRHPVGVYRHPGTGRVLVATTVPAADAFALQKWEFVRKATPEDLRPKPAVVEGGEAPKAAESAATKNEDVEKLKEQLAAAEAAKAEAEAKAAEDAKAREKAEKAAESARKDAEAAQKLAEEAEAKNGQQNTNPNGGKEGSK